MHQRLSDHILLGDSLRRRNPHLYYAPNFACGCAIGGAMASVGAWPIASKTKAYDHIAEVFADQDRLNIDERFAQWPWLARTVPVSQRISGRSLEGGDDTFSEHIGRMFARVCEDEMTIEALAEQVRAWEDLYDYQLRASQEPEVSEVAEREKEEVTL